MLQVKITEFIGEGEQDNGTIEHSLDTSRLSPEAILAGVKNIASDIQALLYYYATNFDGDLERRKLEIVVTEQNAEEDGE